MELSWCYAFSVILLLPAVCWTQNEPGYFITAPDILRVGVSETVLVSLRNTGSSAIPIKLLLQSFPSKDVTYAEETIEVEANQPETVSLRIDPSDVPAVDQGVKQHVYLVAISESEIFPFEKETVILMSYKSGYVFIQTDKPVYTPDQDVKVRTISLNQTMSPSDMPVRLEIRNPQDVIVKLVESVKTETGFITETFHFPPHPLFGNWSVVAYYGHKHQHNTTVQFLVKEYVLPNFEVKIRPTQNYILPVTSKIVADIRASYKFGEPVRGSYHAIFSVLFPSGNLRNLITQQGELDSHGAAVASLLTDELPVGWFEEYVGSRLHIQAFVTEDSSGLTESTNYTRTMFVRSPYVIDYKYTTKFFKKDLPFEVKATILHANGQPAEGVNVNVVAIATTSFGLPELLTGEQKNGNTASTLKISSLDGQVKFSLNVPADTNQINVTLRTSDAALGSFNTQESFTIAPQLSPSGNTFLLARINTDKLNVGRSASVNLLKAGHNSECTFHVIIASGGRIALHKTITSANENVLIDFDVTFDMAPHARLITYFIDNQNHVIADTVWLDVVNRCKDDANVRFVQDASLNRKFQPGEMVNLQIEGYPETRVGLLGVDAAVYMLKDYHRLTGEKMFDAMGEYDLGCGPGGGRNVPAMFKDSGVTVITNADLLVPLREGESCIESARRKRRDTQGQDGNEYENSPELQSYCDMGKEVSINNKSCDDRSVDLANNEALQMDDLRVLAFLNCCKVAHEGQAPGDDRGRVGGLVPSLDELPHPDNTNDVRVRSFFPETWIFDEVEIDDFGMVQYQANTPDSITTWIIQAVGVSKTQGMCVADPIRLRVQPDFFILVHLPYSVIRLEQVEIVATVFNYHSQNLSVRVFLRGIEGVCSESAPGEYSQPRDFVIRPRDTVTVKYNVVPLKIGEFPLEIFVVSARGNDAVQKILKVLPEGVKRERTIPVQLDPAGTRRQVEAARQHGRSGSTVINYFQHDQVRNSEESHQLDHISLDMPPGFVPGSSSVSVNVIGNLLGSAITTIIEGLDSLLEMPRGCGEQTMLYMAPNVYILKYLRETDQLTPEIESVVYRYIEEGITRQLSHRRQDGSFAIWGENENYPSSTWLTAFVNKVFCQAKEFVKVFVDPKITCTAVEWLITNAQEADGSFTEIYKVHHMEMTGGLAGTATMTAFVLISLLECDCKDVFNYQDSVARATAYLETTVPSLQRPYDMSVVTYALALAGSNVAQQAAVHMKAASTYDSERSTRYWEPDASSLDPSQEIPYWYEYRPSAIAVETTSYALLALLQLNELSYSHPIVNWLTEQRNYNGGFVSTQDTVIALQALSEYASQTSVDEVALQCIMTNDIDNEYRETLSLHSGNLLVQQTFKGPKNGKLIVETTGSGVGQLAVQVKYHSVDNSGDRCPFEVTTDAQESRSGKGRTGSDSLYLDTNEIDRSRVGHTEPDVLSRSRMGRMKRDSRSRVGVGAQTGNEELPPIGGGDEEERGRSDIPVDDRGRSKGDFVAEVNVCARYTGNGNTNMAIIDVGLYSGFKPLKSSLDEILNDPYTLVRRYEITDRSVIFYVDQIPSNEAVCVPFTIIREYVVGKIQPVAVRVYDYYSPEKECIKFYHPTTTSSLLATVCEGSTCHCAAGKCPKNACAAQDCTSEYDELLTDICARHDVFAYKAGLQKKWTNGAGFDIYNMNIKAVLKPGDDGTLVESLRTNPSIPVIRQFWKSQNCRELTIGSKREYLIIGQGGLHIQDEHGQPSYKYILDNTYIFEDWPFGQRSTRSRFIPQVKKLQDLQTQMEKPGGGCLL